MIGRNILVIEDNEVNMKLVRSLLHLSKYKVLEANDAESGIELINRSKPDLILMDIQLPGMDGLCATRAIKANPSLKDIPIVALTAYAMEGDDKKALEAGCDGYISKPIDTRSFIKSVNKFLIKDDREDKGSYKPSTYKNKILIVDDEPLNIKLLAAMLPKNYYEIIRAENGAIALEKVAEEAPDLVLLDIMMPNMDGYEVTKKLRSSPATKNIPIILVTALDSEKDKLKGAEAGADEFLSKPVNATELLARINSILRMKQYQEQLTIRVQSEEQIKIKNGFDVSTFSEKDRFRVLLVEDNETDAKLIQMYLKEQPYQIVRAKNGEEAIILAKEKDLDLILLDIVLPDIDGFDLYKRLKGTDEIRNVPVIFVTGLEDMDSRIKGIELGADDFLIKPVDRRQLKARANILLKKRKYIEKLYLHYENAFNSVNGDSLTGLYNYLYFKRFLTLELKRSMSQKYSVAVIMADIDNFKQYNDTAGHLAGDFLLRELAQILKRNIREIDLAARYEGEQFVLVLPYMDRRHAFNLAEKIRKLVGAHIFLQKTSPLAGKITISMGVSVCPENSSDIEELIQQATVMLSKAKKDGKDRVYVYR